MFRKKPPAPTLPPEWVICGLGNPGPQYDGTRHNVGFDVIDKLAKDHKIKLLTRKHQAVYGIGSINGTWVVLVKPVTFMNLSGRAIAPILREFHITPMRLIVVADELDLEPADIKYKAKGSAGGHNGHKSIIHSLGTEDYPRIKIGIGKGGDETTDHVLSKFPPEERMDINDAIAKAAEAVEKTLNSGIEAAIAWLHTGRK